MVCYGFVEMVFWIDIFVICYNKNDEESDYQGNYIFIKMKYIVQ